jgi:hypothetical protein
MSEEGTPAEQYKAIIAGIEAGTTAQRATDQARAKDLAKEFAELDATMRRVGQLTALTRFAVDLHWESALEALTAEPWMVLRPFPRPDPRADPDALHRIDEEMHAAYERLMSLVHRSKWGFRR